MILVNVEIVKFLQRILNINSVQGWLNRAGFPVDAQAYIEQQLQQMYPEQNSKGIMSFIASNYVWFINTDAETVTKKLNDYLLLDPKVISVFGYPITIYSDPAHLRTYAIYLVGAIVLYKMVKR